MGNNVWLLGLKKVGWGVWFYLLIVIDLGQHNGLLNSDYWNFALPLFAVLVPLGVHIRTTDYYTKLGVEEQGAARNHFAGHLVRALGWLSVFFVGSIVGNYLQLPLPSGVLSVALVLILAWLLGGRKSVTLFIMAISFALLVFVPYIPAVNSRWVYFIMGSGLIVAGFLEHRALMNDPDATAEVSSLR